MSMGMLCGLVTVCAFGHIAGGYGTIVVSILAGFQAPVVENIQERLGLDDVVLAFPVHGTAGTVGLLAVPFFVPGGFTFQQLGLQLLGIVVLGGWAAISCGLIYGALKLAGMARVDRETEINGLDKHRTDMTNYPEFMGQSSIPAQEGKKEKVADGGKKGTASDD
jgi:Amt family ammonium transporter